MPVENQASISSDKRGPSIFLTAAVVMLAVLAACSGMILHAASPTAGKHISEIIYNRAILIPNYWNVGFVRRGLGGTVFALLGGADGPFGLAGFQLFCALFLALPLALLVRRLAALGGWQWLYFGAVLILSPQLMLAWSVDPGKGDMLNCGFVAWALLAALDRRFLVAATVLFIGSLVHETVIFLGVGLLAPIWYLLRQADKTTVGRGVEALVLLGVLLALAALLQSIYGPAPRDIVRIMTKHEPPSPLRDLAIYMTAGGAKTLMTSACLGFRRPSAVFTLVADFMILASYIVVLQFKGRTNLWVFAFSAVLPMIALCTVAIDYGRWLCMAVMNAWLASVALRLTGETMATNAKGYVIAGAVGLGLLVMGPSQIYYGNKAVEWVAGRIWIPQTDALILDRCDPKWRTFIEASRAGRNES